MALLKPLFNHRTINALRLAIIDDYLNTSASHFSHISPKRLQITTFNDTLHDSNDLIQRLQPFDLIATIRERTPFPSSLLHQLPNLKLLLATGTQFETFDLKAAKELGIPVVAAPGLGRSNQPKRQNIKKGGAHPTTQHTWALILSLARNIAADDASLKCGRWQTGLATGLTGRTLGIVGLGRLGAAVARIGHLAWGMRVVCWSENLTQEKADKMAVDVGFSAEDKPFQVVSKKELFASADVVSIHYVLSDRSHGIVGASELEMMKPSAFLVNTSRSLLVDQAALINSMELGKIRGAAMDVFETEPLPLDSPWRRVNYWGTEDRSRCIATPHMGYMDEDLINIWHAETAENVERFLEGQELLHLI